MKKLISFFTASSLLISSLGVLAAPNRFGIEKEKDANVDLTMKLSGGNGVYKEYSSEENPLVISVGSSSKPGTLNARATLDMDSVAAEWNTYMNAALEEVSGDDVRSIILDETDLSQSRFTITIESDGNIKNGNGEDVDLVWNSKAQELFEQVGSTSYTEGDTTKYVIEMKIKADNETLDEYFSNSSREDLTLEIRNSSVSGIGEVYGITGTIVGNVVIDIPGDENDMKVTFNGSANGYVKQKVRSGGGSAPVASEEPTEAPTAKPTVTPSEEPTETPSEEPTVTPSEEPTEEPMPTSAPIIPPAPIQTAGTKSGATLNYVDHYAYIIGYDEEETAEDGTTTVKSVVRPENYITRAEVATIFYRLLDETSRESFKTRFNTFTDVDVNDWYNIAISTVAACGIVDGYEDGTFRPNKYITRAEVATIASRFTSLVYEGGRLFNDLDGHWASSYINNATITGWITGYDDGSFKPNANITRAEAITLINRVLYRKVTDDGLHENLVEWEYNTEDKWYYKDVQEATNSHDYDREEIGKDETMTDVLPNPDWSADEK